MEDIKAAIRIQTAYLSYKKGYTKKQIGEAVNAVEKGKCCPISQETLTARTVAVTPCIHAFESNQLMGWLQLSKHGNCPTCRTVIVSVGHAHVPQPPAALTPDQTAIVTALRDQGVDFYSENRVKDAIANGLGDKTRAEVLTLLTQPEVEAAHIGLYNTATRIVREG